MGRLGADERIECGLFVGTLRFGRRQLGCGLLTLGMVDGRCNFGAQFVDVGVCGHRQLL
ncbi:hypothetical protein [Rhizobium rhizoryzae]|uniref:hypothetical protein n=1 Tax=Rhizobium rhizoryzae TaxID=451876 RepID=UPI0028A85868|nr:hypothetical protein [Rhizobium rhizoryzae]